jgi:peptidoglycan hydrolase-like protein with peptidoglycan-binding domain
MALAGAQFNAKHSRGPGGLFAATAAANGKPTGAWASGPVQSGAAHGKTTDPRVKALQQALNLAGVTDERGRPLLVDGKPGAHTSAAIKKWQQAHGMKPTGTVDAKTMVALLTAKAPARKAAAVMRRARPSVKKSAPKRKATPKSTSTAASRAVALAPKRGQSRLGGGY